MSLNQKLILVSLLLVTGSGWLFTAFNRARVQDGLRARDLASNEQRVEQIAAILGLDLVSDPGGGSRAGRDIRETMSRILQRTKNCHALYSLLYQDGRALIGNEARAEGRPRGFGTPVSLPETGHRARRTGLVQSSVEPRDGLEITRVFAPILDQEGRVLGLLVQEANLEMSALGWTDIWSDLLLFLAVGVLGAALLVPYLTRPLSRLQDQLIAKENLPRQRVSNPSDLLREVTRVIDLAHQDSSVFAARLEQQDEEQEKLNRIKDEVISNTVHELRTPLTSIIASLEIVLQYHDMMSTEEQHEFLMQATTTSKHMMFVVNDMLDTAAIEAGKVSMEIDRCSLARLLADSKRSMDLVAAAKGTRLNVASVEPDVHVLADSARVMQVIFNLVSNAVKYSPAGSTVRVMTHQEPDLVTIEVEDEGECIPVEKRTQLFTKFSKFSRDSDGPPVHSSGIGLYLSKRLVERMRGMIGYREASSGQGSVFWFTLPVAAENPAETSATLDISNTPQ